MNCECDNCCENAALSGIELTKKAYEKHGVKYSIYEGNNRFYGTPIPQGYDALYIDDGFFPPGLQLRKKIDTDESLTK